MAGAVPSVELTYYTPLAVNVAPVCPDPFVFAVTLHVLVIELSLLLRRCNLYADGCNANLGSRFSLDPSLSLPCLFFWFSDQHVWIVYF